MNKGVKTSFIVFLILEIVVTTGFFLLGFETSTINVLALCFLAFSILVSMFNTMLLVKEKRDKDTLYHNAGIGSATALYQAAVIVSVFLSRAFENNVKGFIFLQIAINALMFVICTLIVTASRHVNDNTQRTSENQENGGYDKPKRGGF